MRRRRSSCVVMRRSSVETLSLVWEGACSSVSDPELWWAGALVKGGEMRGESRQGLRCFGALWCFGGWVAVEEALGCC